MTDSSDSAEINERFRKSWSQQVSYNYDSQEDNVLAKLVKKYGNKRWTDISKAMAELFQLTGKSGKQCRQRWINHLDPKINKQKWTIQEERKIFDAHKTHGNKWRAIAKQLENRTDNSIKNHFYSILRKGLRRLNKLIGDRKSTERVKQIRTSVLSKLQKLQQTHKENNINVNNIYELLFKFSSINWSKMSEKNLSEDIKIDLKEMIDNLTEISSEEKIKKEKNVAMNKNKRSKHLNETLIIEQKNPSNFFIQQKNIPEVMQFQKDMPRNVAKKFNDSKISSEEKIITPNLNNKKYFSQQNTSQKSHTDSLLSSDHREKNQHPQPLAKLDENCEFQQLQKQEEFNVFPNITINLEDQSLSIVQSNDFSFNCLNKSPLFPSSRLVDHFKIRTPRVPSPGAFNFCGVASTAQSINNIFCLNQKEIYDKSKSFDNQLQSIVEQLRSNIDANSNNLGSLQQQRVNSSRNSLIEPCSKSSSSIFLTPRSGQGKAH